MSAFEECLFYPCVSARMIYGMTPFAAMPVMSIVTPPQSDATASIFVASAGALTWLSSTLSKTVASQEMQIPPAFRSVPLEDWQFVAVDSFLQRGIASEIDSTNATNIPSNSTTTTTTTTTTATTTASTNVNSTASTATTTTTSVADVSTTTATTAAAAATPMIDSPILCYAVLFHPKDAKPNSLLTDKLTAKIFIHGARSSLNENLNGLTGDVQQLDLSYVPICITHIPIYQSRASAPSTASLPTGTSLSGVAQKHIIAVSGNDNLIHFYAQKSDSAKFEEYIPGKTDYVATFGDARFFASLTSLRSVTLFDRLPIVVAPSTSSTSSSSSMSSNRFSLRSTFSPTFSPYESNTPISSAAPSRTASRATSPKRSDEWNDDTFQPIRDIDTLKHCGAVVTLHSIHIPSIASIFAVGSQTGLLRILINRDYPLEERGEIETMKWLDGAISAVRLFVDSSSSASSPNVSLLVLSALGFAIIYSNVLEFGLKNFELLPKSDQYDSLMCCEIIEVENEGRMEIVIGSYAGELLMYRSMSSTTTTTKQEWQLVGTRAFAAPIYRLFLCTFLGKLATKRFAQLCLLTSDGVSILQ